MEGHWEKIHNAQGGNTITVLKMKRNVSGGKYDFGVRVDECKSGLTTQSKCNLSLYCGSEPIWVAGRSNGNGEVVISLLER